MSIIRFEDVDVIFSKDPREALKLLDQGMTRNEILKKTGQIVGVEATDPAGPCSPCWSARTCTSLIVRAPSAIATATSTSTRPGS